MNRCTHNPIESETLVTADGVCVECLQDELKIAKYLLNQIINSLPQKRDWLDPVIEKASRNLIKE